MSCPVSAGAGAKHCSNNAKCTSLKYGLYALAGYGALSLLRPVLCSIKRKLTDSLDKKNTKINFQFQQQYEEFNRIYPQLSQDFRDFISKQYQLPQEAIDRLKRMFDYTILGGKYNRATLVTNTVQILCKHSNLNIDARWEQALVLGWCIEILQALFLVADDMMDKSVTRRGEPCWYKVPGIEEDAINDTLILESFMWFLINKYFEKHPKLVDIIQLFQSVSLQTQMGQMLDLLGEKKRTLDSFDIDVYTRIVTYKTAIYTFYLPVACGMILCDYTSPSQLALARSLSIQIGIKFQIEDDYLDAYGDPKVIGKIGTDVKDHKCSWLVVQALNILRKDKESQQYKTLLKYYGVAGDEADKAVKQLYKDLNIEDIYFKQEDQSYDAILSELKSGSIILPEEVFLPVLEKIHRRQK